MLLNSIHLSKCLCLTEHQMYLLQLVEMTLDLACRTPVCSWFTACEIYVELQPVTSFPFYLFINIFFYLKNK